MHGKIAELKEYEMVTAPVIQRMIYDILSDEQIQRFRYHLELDWPIPPSASPASASTPTATGRRNVAAAMRVIPSDIPHPAASSICWPKVIMDLANRPRGLMLVTGPTGSGKSTTLAAVINTINQSHEGHIITIEDPIEFVHQHKRCVVNQREVGADTSLFANALRAALREDPDVILVGEMRDNETIHLAISAAETGHLVFGTLHTNSAAESVDRMVGVFPSSQQEQIRTQVARTRSRGYRARRQLLPRVGAGSRRRHRDHDRQLGHSQPDSRKQSAPDDLHHPDAERHRHADHGPGLARPSCTGQGEITQHDAYARAHNAAELEVMMLNRDLCLTGTRVN